MHVGRHGSCVVPVDIARKMFHHTATVYVMSYVYHNRSSAKTGLLRITSLFT